MQGKDFLKNYCKDAVVGTHFVYLQDFGLSKSLSNHLKIYIHGSQNWFQIVSRSKWTRHIYNLIFPQFI